MSHSLGKLAHRCLVCHEHIGEWHGASVRCPWCDEVNLRVDQERCWTLSPRARLIERVLKYGGTVGVAATTYALLGFDGTPTAEGWKVFAVMGTLIPAALWWDMTSLVTRRRSRTRIEVLVPAIFLVLGVAPLLWSLFQALWGDSANLVAAFVRSLGVLLVLQPFVFASWLLVTGVERMRRRAANAPSHRAADEAREAALARSRAARGAATPEAVLEVRRARELPDAVRDGERDHVTIPDTHSYCLHCFAPMLPIEGASGRCDVCGGSSLRVDQERYWTRHVRFERVERSLKVAAVVFAALAVWWIDVKNSAVADDVTWLGPLGIPLVTVALVVVWDLSGMITRRRSTLKLEVFLPFAVALTGPALVVVGRATMASEKHALVGPRPHVDLLPWSYAVPFLLAAPVAWFAIRWFLDWREIALARGLRNGRIRMVESSTSHATR